MRYMVNWGHVAFRHLGTGLLQKHPTPEKLLAGSGHIQGFRSKAIEIQKNSHADRCYKAHIMVCRIVV